MSVAIIPDFVKYQIEWLTSHNDLEFEPVIEDAIVQMLKDTGKSFIDEQAAETSQIDHIADVSKKVERTAETAQNTSSSCTHENDVIFRKAAIDAVVDEFKRSPTPAIRAKLRLEALPPAQPEKRWIPCSERLPEEGSYLVWMPFAPPEERIAVADYCDGYWNIKTPISAWMPLPEPYRGGDEDERNRIIEIGFAHFDDLPDGMEAEL